MAPDDFFTIGNEELARIAADVQQRRERLLGACPSTQSSHTEAEVSLHTSRRSRASFAVPELLALTNAEVTEMTRLRLENNRMGTELADLICKQNTEVREFKTALVDLQAQVTRSETARKDTPLSPFSPPSTMASSPPFGTHGHGSSPLGIFDSRHHSWASVATLESSRSSSLDSHVDVNSLIQTFLPHATDFGFFLDWNLLGQSTMQPMLRNRSPDRPSPALLNAVYMWGAHLAGDILTEDRFKYYAVHCAATDLLHSHLHPHSFLHTLQAEVLLSHYFFRTGHFLEARSHTATAVALALGGGLHQVPPNMLPNRFDLDTRSFCSDPIPGMVQLPLGIPMVHHINGDPKRAITIVRAHTLESLMQYEEGEQVKALIPRLMTLSWGVEATGGNPGVPGIFRLPGIKRNLRSKQVDVNSLPLGDGSYNLASTHGEGEGHGNFMPAVQTNTPEAAAIIKEVLQILHRLYRLIMPLCVSRFEWDMLEFNGIDNNVVVCGGLEPGPTSCQLNASTAANVVDIPELAIPRSIPDISVAAAKSSIYQTRHRDTACQTSENPTHLRIPTHRSANPTHLDAHPSKPDTTSENPTRTIS
ncbi:hypothetical protein B0H10DRAFT_2195488 [Mycena sp. CBHHK59/15]|nr:hypothetical protein B0H10DRAFT_2195488 [Mycena sp. CBHHK59/15]